MLPRSRSEELTSSKVELPNDKHDALKALPKGAASSNGQVPDDKHDDLRTMESNLNTTDSPLVFTRDFPYEGSDLNTASDPQDLEIIIPPRYLWLLNILPLESIDPVGKMARFVVPPTYRPRPRNKYFVENAIEHLDKPGEWVFESKTGRIYLWPKQSLKESDIRAPFLQEFIRVEGIEDKSPVKHVNFIGLTFHHGLRDTVTSSDIGLQYDWEMYDKGNAVLRFRHAEDCTVDSCTFTASSGGGVRLDLRCQHITVKNSIFSHLGGTGGLLSGYGPGFKDENHDNTVDNNLFHHVGEIYWQCPAIFITQSGRNLISHNTIHDLTYNAIVVSGVRSQYFIFSKPYANNREWVKSIRFKEAASLIDKGIAQKIFDINFYEPLLHARENHIEENEIYRVMLLLHDGDAIYLSSMGKNNRLDRNYIHDVQNSSGAIRMDDESTFTFINENVVADCNLFITTTAHQELRNNFALDVGAFLKKRGPIDSERNIFYKTDPKAVSYLAAAREKVNFYKVGNFTTANSIYYAVNVPPDAHSGEDLCPPDEQDNKKIGLLFVDPMFDREAMKQKIFRFMPGSPTEKLGIQPLDLSHVGCSVSE